MSTHESCIWTGAGPNSSGKPARIAIIGTGTLLIQPLGQPSNSSVESRPPPPPNSTYRAVHRKDRWVEKYAKSTHMLGDWKLCWIGAAPTRQVCQLIMTVQATPNPCNPWLCIGNKIKIKSPFLQECLDQLCRRLPMWHCYFAYSL